MLFDQPGIHRRTKIEMKLPFGARHVRKGGDSDQFPVLVADHITNKDIGKQVFF
jgi:hypothetical protein